MRRDSQSEYYVDGRSGSEASDSDSEFDAIVKVDQLVQTLRDNVISTPEEFQNSIFELVEALSQIPGDLLELEPLRDVFEEIIAAEVPDFLSDQRVLEMV